MKCIVCAGEQNDKTNLAVVMHVYSYVKSGRFFIFRGLLESRFGSGAAKYMTQSVGGAVVLTIRTAAAARESHCPGGAHRLRFTVTAEFAHADAAVNTVRLPPYW